MDERPDIVIITIDALRVDALGCYGGRVPHQGLGIDRFADKAILFKNHYSVATSSLMSLYTWYTGIPPHLMPINNLNTATIPINQVDNLGSILDRAGYLMLTTMEERCGNPEMFPLKEGDRNYRQEPLFHLFQDPPFLSCFPGIPDYRLYGIASEAVPYALEWFRQTPSPRFLHLWVTDLHVTHRHPRFRHSGGLTEAKPVVFHPNPIIGRYYDTVALVDASISLFLHEIEALSKNILIILGSDHGEALGERQLAIPDAEWFATDNRQYDHGYPEQIENTLIHTPLIVKPPGNTAPRQVSELVSAIDFFSTILEYVQPDLMPKASLLQNRQPWNALWSNEQAKGHEFVLSHTRWLVEPDRSSALITNEGWKLIKHARREPELYFLPEDRSEFNNLWNRVDEGRKLLECLRRIEEAASENIQHQPLWTL